MSLLSPIWSRRIVKTLSAARISKADKLADPGKFCYICEIETHGWKPINLNNTIMKEQVLKAMREAGKPVSAGDVTKALGADRKEVDKAFAELKKEGAIVSPVRCKWEPAK